jgi:hypothetical protein
MSTKKEPLSPVQLAHKALEQYCQIKELCTMCGAKIKTLIFKGTGVCSEDCRKDRDGDHEPAQGIVPGDKHKIGYGDRE